MPAVQETVDQVRRIDVDQYKYGFETLIESEKAPKGLSEDTVRFISAKKNEPQWMLDWRLEAYKRWQTMREPTWARVGGRRVRFCFGCDDLQGRAEEGRRDLHADVGGCPRASRTGEEISWLGRSDLGQFLRDIEFSGVL